MLTGKVAVVTGGARGNGEGIARVFAAEGATVCLWDVLDTVAGTAERIAAEYGRPCRAWQVDISDAAAVDMAAAEVLETFGTVDILVNNAAIAPEVPFVEMDPHRPRTRVASERRRRHELRQSAPPRDDAQEAGQDHNGLLGHRSPVGHPRTHDVCEHQGRAIWDSRATSPWRWRPTAST